MINERLKNISVRKMVSFETEEDYEKLICLSKDLGFLNENGEPDLSSLLKAIANETVQVTKSPTYVPNRLEIEEKEDKIDILLTEKQYVENKITKKAHEWLNFRKKCSSGIILGNAGTGKTSACNIYAENNTDVLKISIPVGCQAKQFYSSIIEALHYLPYSKNLTELRIQALEKIQRNEISMLILDNAINLSTQMLAELTELSDKNISVILVGTLKLDRIVKRNESIKNRFISKYFFQELDQETFIELTLAWIKNVYFLPKSELNDSEIMTALWDKTQGNLSILDSILRAAAIECIKNDYDKFDKTILTKTIEAF